MVLSLVAQVNSNMSRRLSFTKAIIRQIMKGEA
jgi:hypothetical protein